MTVNSERGSGALPLESGYVPVLDVWRGTAILLLLLGHFFHVPRINCGRLGVEFFFVLSGFLMGRILFVKQTTLLQFYQRRVSRILPAAYTFLLANWLYNASSSSAQAQDFPQTASSFLFYLNYYVALCLDSSFGVSVAHFWSLCVEEHVYIVLSLMAVICRYGKVSPLILLGLGVMFCLSMARWIGPEYAWDYYKVYWRSDTRGASILFGAIAACLVSRGVGRQSTYFGISSAWLGLGMLGIGMICQFEKMPDFWKYSVGTTILAAALILISQHIPGRSALFRPLIALGTVSYSLYLWQQPFYFAKATLGVPLALTGALTCGIASYYLVERPARRWLNARWSKDTKTSIGNTVS